MFLTSSLSISETCEKVSLCKSDSIDMHIIPTRFFKNLLFSTDKQICKLDDAMRALPI